MSLASFTTPDPYNQSWHAYAPGSPEKVSLKAELERQRGVVVEAPMVIDGQEVETGEFGEMRCPHDHGHLLGKAHYGSVDHVKQAIEAAERAKPEWSRTPWEERAGILLKAADIIAGSYRDVINASTMLGQSKNVFQSEIDAIGELCDFFRFNARFAQEIFEEQPLSPDGQWNRLEYRGLDGFVLAVTPFNFTAIAANLPTGPMLMGNTVVWKPSDKAMLSAHYTMEVLRKAGLPDGVINLVYGEPAPIVGAALEDPRLAALHFTGSAAILKHLFGEVGRNMDRYRCFPRIIGESGGKDFIFVHESAELDKVAAGFVRGAFEYQGQKCSAASRGYVPRTVWPELKERIVELTRSISMGPVEDFRHFMAAVISKDAFDRCKDYIDHAREASDAEILVGGGCDDSKGYFVEPTVIETSNPHYRSMEEEIFGPVLTIHTYDPKDFEATLELCDRTSPYALTGSIFSTCRKAVATAHEKLRFSAGNFYVNDKCTGSIVGQQPFGGSRLSGTNDKAGSKLNLLRFTSPRAIKETHEAPTTIDYPHMGEA